MVRIIGEKKESTPKQQEPEKLTHKTNVLLNVIGIVMADNPEAIRDLLAAYDVPVDDKTDEHELTDKLLLAIGKGNKKFDEDLAELILDNTLDNQYDSFDFKSLLSGAGGGNGDQGSGGGGILGGITSAIGSIGNAVSQGAQKRQASSQTLQGVLAYRQQQSKTEQSKNKAKVQMLIGLFLLFGICILAIAGFKRQQKLKQALIPIKK